MKKIILLFILSIYSQDIFSFVQKQKNEKDVDTEIEKIRYEYNQVLELSKIQDPSNRWNALFVNQSMNPTLFYIVENLKKEMGIQQNFTIYIFKGNTVLNNLAKFSGIDNRVNAFANNQFIMIGDELIKNLTLNELQSVITLELAHFKLEHSQKYLKYIVKNSLIGIGTLILTHLLARKNDFYQNHKYKILLTLNSLAGIIISSKNAKLSQQYEKEADQEALKYIKDKNSFKTGLSKAMHMMYERAEYNILHRIFSTHPPLLDRINF